MYLRITAQETRLDFYPYAKGIEEIRNAAIDSYAIRDRILDERDFWRLVKIGIERASMKTLEKCWDEAIALTSITTTILSLRSSLLNGRTQLKNYRKSTTEDES